MQGFGFRGFSVSGCVNCDIDRGPHQRAQLKKKGFHACGYKVGFQVKPSTLKASTLHSQLSNLNPQPSNATLLAHQRAQPLPHPPLRRMSNTPAPKSSRSALGAPLRHAGHLVKTKQINKMKTRIERKSRRTRAENHVEILKIEDVRLLCWCPAPPVIGRGQSAAGALSNETLKLR